MIGPIIKELSKNMTKEWFEALERGRRREEACRKFYDENYADKITYNQYKYLLYLEKKHVRCFLPDNELKELFELTKLIDE